MNEQSFFDYVKYQCNKVLTDEQREAVVYNDKSICLRSTAGSGKTTTLTTKIAYLVLVKGISPSRIAVVSFSKASAADMKERFYSLFGELISEDIHFSTIHSFAYSLIRKYEKKMMCKYTIIEETKGINKNVILSNLYKKYNNEPINEDQLKELVGFITYIRNMLIYYNKLDNYSDSFPVPNFKEIYKEYSEMLIENKYLDYDSLLTMAHMILSRNEDIRKEYQSKYDVFLCDESQDNSKIQNAIIKILTPNSKVTFVGDSNQCIYSWRGVDFNEFSNFKTLYPNSKVLYMYENFRSTSTIVNHANAFIKTNNPKDRDIVSNKEKGEKIELVDTENEHTQVEYIIDKIKSSNKEYSNYAVLYRNNLSAIPLVDKFTKENIPFYIKDEVGSFFNNFIVNDLLDFIDFAVDQTRVDKFRKIYYKCKSYLNKEQVNSVEVVPDEYTSVLDVFVKNPKCTTMNKHRLESLKKKFNGLSKIKPKDVVDSIQHDLNYREYLDNYAEKFNYSTESIDNILATIKVICTSINAVGELRDKLEELRQEMIASKKNKGTDAVTLSSCHSSKGLEWAEIFLIDTHMLPSKGAITKAAKGDKAELEEEGRAYFVAITRPKEMLHILHPIKKNNQAVPVSPFYARSKEILEGSSVVAKTKEKVAVNKKEILELNDIKIGSNIQHKVWGNGIITNINADKDSGAIMLSNGQVKNISLSVCIKGKIIKIVQ